MGRVVLRAETLHHRVKAVWEPAGDKEQAEVPALVSREKAEERDKAAVTDGKRLIIQSKTKIH